ncbi:MAG: twin-arginine translocation signal domain-containing protein [Campylobacterales bacterium]|nr:twin-arginine translocation signal domain-containing protein [Campylobacterales bacterium]MBN2833114.1 twin-arginine translocation signal domain-containing protein [Campylobacterales bacterium]
MTKMRRSFLKTAVLGSAGVAIGVSPLLSAEKMPSALGGVVVGKSKKKEITYKKTQAWEDYYKSAL